MIEPSSDREPGPALSAQAWSEWNRTVDSVMRGVAHALNNRAAALSAVLELAGDADGPESTVSILTTELQRVRDLSAVVRTMGAPRLGTEAYAPRDAATDALAVLMMHADQRERVVMIEAAPGAAVRTPKWMFVRALVALVASVPQDGATARTIRVSIADEDDWVVARADGVTGTLAERSPCATELARAMGGDALDVGYGFRLPSLTAVRRREGR